jgi:hypothetical protein
MAKRQVTNEKKAAHDVMPDYVIVWQRQFAEGAWLRGRLFDNRHFLVDK